jgi:imidazolonepropionase-like amidohydrolase
VRVDGRGKFLIPGLADMHAHITDGEVTLFLELANGVTTIRSMFDAPMDLVRRTRTGELLSPRIYNAAPLDPGVSQIAGYKTAGYDFLKFYEYGSENFEAAVAEAHRVGIPIAGHVPVGVGLERVLRAGYASIEHLSGYLEYLTGLRADTDLPDSSGWRQAVEHVDESKIRAIVAATKRAGVWICPTLAAWKGMSLDSITKAQKPGRRYQKAGDYALNDESRVTFRLQFELKRKLIKPLHDAGVGLLLGTDPVLDLLVPGFSIPQELEELVAAGLTPYQALVTGTRNAAIFFGTLDSTGTVTARKRADLVLLAGNPLVDIRHTAHPTGVMIGGRWFSRDELDTRLAALEQLVIGDI